MCSNIGFGEEIGILEIKVRTLSGALVLTTGAISGYLCARLGAPVTATLGTLIMSAGMLASAFVDNVYIMYATFGAVGGK